MKNNLIAICLFFIFFGEASASYGRQVFLDPIETPAIQSHFPSSQPLTGLVKAQTHIVAVGSRGVVITGSLEGRGWEQASVPVQSDLTDVFFLNNEIGWAVGHDGVILKTIDGGHKWVKQADGITLKNEFESYYNAKINSSTAQPSSNASTQTNRLALDLTEVKENFDPGPILPWMGVWFMNAKTGYVVGPFGDIARTDDGGKSWAPWLDHIDNPNFYDLNAIKSVAGNLFIVGEQGGVYLYDQTQNKFINRSTSYTGPLFGLCGNAQELLVFGLRGHIYRSTDLGKNWVESADPSSSTIMSGTELPNGDFVLVTLDGNILLSSDGGIHFKPFAKIMNTALSDIIYNKGKIIITSLTGVRVINISALL